MRKYLLYSFTYTLFPIRGGIDWAPPRKTIIHNIHSPVSWKDLPKALNVWGNRCIGCGMSLESNQIKFFFFCNYIGKYFCVSCHQNSLSSITAYIILRWTFKRFCNL